MSWRNEGLLEQVLYIFPLFPPLWGAKDVFVVTGTYTFVGPHENSASYYYNLKLKPKDLRRSVIYDFASKKRL